MIVSERTARDKETGEWVTTMEKRLYISSLSVDPALALKVVRAHWGIENRRGPLRAVSPLLRNLPFELRSSAHPTGRST